MSLVQCWMMPFLQVCSRLDDSEHDEGSCQTNVEWCYIGFNGAEPGVSWSVWSVVSVPWQRGYTGPKGSTVVHRWIATCNVTETYGRVVRMMFVSDGSSASIFLSCHKVVALEAVKGCSFLKEEMTCHVQHYNKSSPTYITCDFPRTPSIVTAACPVLHDPTYTHTQIYIYKHKQITPRI